jgi:hypothetical protein
MQILFFATNINLQEAKDQHLLIIFLKIMSFCIYHISGLLSSTLCPFHALSVQCIEL